MSTLLQEIVTAVNTEIMPNLPMMSSERKRIEMRVTLSALEKMIKHIRQELLNESKQLKSARKQKRVAKLNKNSPPDNTQLGIAHE
jgi:neutral trehalase